MKLLNKETSKKVAVLHGELCSAMATASLIPSIQSSFGRVAASFFDVFQHASQKELEEVLNGTTVMNKVMVALGKVGSDHYRIPLLVAGNGQSTPRIDSYDFRYAGFLLYLEWLQDPTVAYRHLHISHDNTSTVVPNFLYAFEFPNGVVMVVVSVLDWAVQSVVLDSPENSIDDFDGNNHLAPFTVDVKVLEELLVDKVFIPEIPVDIKEPTFNPNDPHQHITVSLLGLTVRNASAAANGFRADGRVVIHRGYGAEKDIWLYIMSANVHKIFASPTTHDGDLRWEALPTVLKVILSRLDFNDTDTVVATVELNDNKTDFVVTQQPVTKE